jgi:hypothetical protein
LRKTVGLLLLGVLALILVGCGGGPAHTTPTTTPTTPTTVAPSTSTAPPTSPVTNPPTTLPPTTPEPVTLPPRTPPTVNAEAQYQALLNQCVTAEYPDAYQQSVPEFQQALGRLPTQAEVEKVATDVCQGRLQSEGISP